MTLRYLPLLLLALAATARADIYSYVDSRGIPHFSNVPDNKHYRPILSAQRSPQAALSASAQASLVLAGRQHFSPLVAAAARTYQVDAALLHAVITAESGYKATAVSHKGAVGLMQLMPKTARRFGVADSFDPEQNIRGGTQYLSYLLQLFGNNLELAIAAYNAGEEAVISHGYSVPPYRETQGYVPKVLNLHRQYRAIL